MSCRSCLDGTYTSTSGVLQDSQKEAKKLIDSSLREVSAAKNVSVLTLPGPLCYKFASAADSRSC
jgi:hypothetical protein